MKQGLDNLSSRIAGRNTVRFSVATLGVIGVFASASPALAAGTTAGTDIQNIATASYDVSGTPVSIQSNASVIKVDELLDVVVTSTNPGDVQTTPGAPSVVLTYRVTNTGNGTETFNLTPNVTKGGDDFDPGLVKVVIDTDNNGVYDPGVDEDYVPGTNDPALNPDESVNVFIITSTPSTTTNGNRAEVNLTATAKTGSGSAGTTFPGAGQGGGDAVVGNSTAKRDASGFEVVLATSVVLTKSATVLDPFGGTTAVPGSVITYTLVATIGGSGTLNGLVIADPIPSGTNYQANSITLQAAALTDAADADAGNYNGTRISVSAGNIPAGETRTVTFKVKIQ